MVGGRLHVLNKPLVRFMMNKNQMGGMMGGSSLYEDENAPAAPPNKDQESTAEDQGESGEESTVIPKTAVPTGTKVGDTITFRVTEDYGDEFGLAPVSGNKSSDNSMMANSNSEIAAMDESD